MNNSDAPQPFCSPSLLHRDHFRFFIIILSLLLFCGAAMAKTGKHQMKYYAPFDNGAYNPDTLASVEGSIVGIITMDAKMTPMIVVPTVALRVKKEDGKYILIQLAPYWYMMGRAFIFRVGQKIKATGSMMGQKDNKYLVAKKVIAGVGEDAEEEEDYRDDFGIPVWSNIGDSLADIEWEEE